jgi:hypothetical protein
MVTELFKKGGWGPRIWKKNYPGSQTRVDRKAPDLGSGTLFSTSSWADHFDFKMQIFFS